MVTSLISLTQKLIQFPSITPDQKGCLDFIQVFLETRGFQCEKLVFNGVDNLYARIGTGPVSLCFAGHVDVVPPGLLEKWSYPPFEGVISQERIYGRGAVDMKGAIACFLSALEECLKEFPQGLTVGLMLTSDEEGLALNGTKKIVEWLKEKGEKINYCLVGEPTNPFFIGEMIKIGRRGSLNIKVIIEGVSGHVAYPEEALNPLPFLLTYLNALLREPLDKGNKFFPPSSLQITSIDTNNPIRNVIPSRATALLNIRFNNEYNKENLLSKLTNVWDFMGFDSEIGFSIDDQLSANPFLTENTYLSSLIEEAIFKVTQKKPFFSTTGGTSDARFIYELCPVIEFGLINQTAHKIDENVKIKDLILLKSIYKEVLKLARSC